MRGSLSGSPPKTGSFGSRDRRLSPSSPETLAAGKPSLSSSVFRIDSQGFDLSECTSQNPAEARRRSLPEAFDTNLEGTRSIQVDRVRIDRDQEGTRSVPLTRNEWNAAQNQVGTPESRLTKARREARFRKDSQASSLNNSLQEEEISPAYASPDQTSPHQSESLRTFSRSQLSSSASAGAVPSLASLPWERRRRSESRKSSVQLDTGAVMDKLSELGAAQHDGTATTEFSAMHSWQGGAIPEECAPARHEKSFAKPNAAPPRERGFEKSFADEEDDGERDVTRGEFGGSFLQTQLMAARGMLGDGDQRNKLAEKRRSAATQEWKQQEAAMQKRLGNLRDEIAQSMSEYETHMRKLQESGKQRDDAQACLGGVGKELTDMLFTAGWIGSSMDDIPSSPSGRMRSATEEFQQIRAMAALYQEQSARGKQLQSEVHTAAVTQRTTKETIAAETAKLGRQLALREEAYRELRNTVHAENSHVQELTEQGQASETRARQALQHQEDRLERLRLQQRRSQEEVRICRETCDERWAERLARQVTQKDERNWQLQRRVAESETGLEIIQSSSQGLPDICRQLRKQLEADKEVHEQCVARRDEARGMTAAARAEEDAQRRAQERAAEEVRCYQNALVDSLRSIVKVRNEAAKDASERALKADVEVLRAEVAQEAEFLQAQLQAHGQLSARASGRLSDRQSWQLSGSQAATSPTSLLQPYSAMLRSPALGSMRAMG